jgi:hypothetical protein
MKEIYCKECKKTYKINYIYTHRQKKSHLDKIKKPINLLEENDDNENTLRNTNLFLNELKDKIEEFINEIKKKI